MTSTILPPKTGTGLPREVYVSDTIFQQELREWFHTSWQYAGHVSQLERPGAFRRFQQGNADLLIMRGADGVIRALHNTCRHRGAQLIDTSEGVCKRVVACSYHGWSYDTTGALKGAPKMGADFNRESFSLHEAEIEIWNGIIFVRVDGTTGGGSVAETLADVVMPFRDLADAKVAKVVQYELKCNWKASWENALECYHCAINHPQLVRILDPEGDAGGAGGGFDYVFMNNPLMPGKVSVTPSGQLESKVTFDLLVPIEDARVFLQWHRSPFEFIASPDHVALMTYTPLTPERTIITQTFIVSGNAQPDVDFDPETMFGMHILAREEDNVLCEKIQAGVRNIAYTPGPFNEIYEQENHRFLAAYRSVMGQAIGE